MVLRWLADRGAYVLISGILAGLFLPALARILVPFIPAMVAGLLFLAALRIGPHRMRAALGDLRQTALIVMILQLGLPMLVIGVLAVFGLLASPFALALILICMAPAISGSPNIVAMMGRDPAEAMRFLVMGTALLPLSVIPVLWALPALGAISEVVVAAIRLLVVVVGSALAAFGLRLTVLRAPAPETLKAIDGASALLLAVIVIGLMSAVSAAMLTAPHVFWGWLAFVFVVNFGLQALGYHLSRGQPRDTQTALTIISGNRNIALFLVALPEAVTAPLLVFIGCYQVPMYLTPLITGAALRRQHDMSAR